MQNEIAMHVLVTLVCVHVGGDDGPQPRQETCCAVQRVIEMRMKAAASLLNLNHKPVVILSTRGGIACRPPPV